MDDDHSRAHQMELKLRAQAKAMAGLEEKNRELARNLSNLQLELQIGTQKDLWANISPPH